MVVTTVDLAISLRTWVSDNSACFLMPCTESRSNKALENEIYVDGFVEQSSIEGCGP